MPALSQGIAQLLRGNEDPHPVLYIQYYVFSTLLIHTVLLHGTI